MWVLLLVPVVYAATVIESSLGDSFQVGRVTPDLLAMTAIVWLLVAGGPRAFLVAGAIGLWGDLVAPGRVGVGTACYLLVGYVVTRLKRWPALEHLAGQTATVFATVTVLAAALGLGRCLLGESALAPGAWLARSVGVGLYTAGVSLPLLMVIGWAREPLLRRNRRLAEF